MAEQGSTEGAQSRNLWQRSFDRVFNRAGSGDQTARFAELASGFSKELAKHLNNGTLVLVLGQSATEVIADQTRQYIDENSGLVFGKIKNSSEAVGVFSQFRAIDPNTRVVLIVDEGLPKDPIKDGLMVAKTVSDSVPGDGNKPKVFMVRNVKRDIKTDRTLPLALRAKDTLGDNYVGSIPTTNQNNILPIAFDSLQRGVSFEDASREFSERDRKARERHYSQSLLEAHNRVINQLEATESPRFKERAQQVLDELTALSGKKAFALIIDDYVPKVADIRKSVLEEGQEKGLNYVIRDVQDGDEGIVFYEEFAKLAPDERVLVLMDGNLEHDDKGSLVVERLVEATKRHNLPMPFIVGTSSDLDKNEDIRDQAPESYIGFYFEYQDGNRVNFHDALSEKL
ncbi:MAG: hypothetical protein AAB414_01215 [Patescibacteria group bacterium]